MIYLSRNGVQAGPYSRTEFDSLLAQGLVFADDLIWWEGMDRWLATRDTAFAQDLISNLSGRHNTNHSIPTYPPVRQTVDDNTQPLDQKWIMLLLLIIGTGFIILTISMGI